MFIIIFGTLGLVIYLGIFDITPYINERCDLYTGVCCSDYQVSTSGVVVRLQNGLPIDMQNVVFNVTDCAVAAGPTSILSGDTQEYTATCSLASGDIVNSKLEFTYTNPDNGVDHQKAGKLVAKIR